MLDKSKYLLKKSHDIIMERGNGIYLYDNKGKKYMDLTACAWSMNLGYGNKKVEKAIINQIKRLPHCRTHFYTKEKLLLAEKISKLSPIPNGQIDFCLHGSEANEGAMKLALNYNKGSGTILYLEDGFHGRSLATMGITWKHQNKNFVDWYGKGIECKKDIIDILDKIIVYNPSAIIIELIQGNGGMNPLDKQLVQDIRLLCNDYNITLIVDEIQTAFGRCGVVFLSELYNIIPDIITFGKGISSGMPLFGTISKPRYVFEKDDHSFTFAHFPVSMASALAYLDQMTSKLLAETFFKGEYIIYNLENLKKEFHCLGKIKGIGLMLGIEIIDDFGDPYILLAEEIVKEMLERKIIMNLDKCEGYGYTLKYKPALTITFKEIDYSFKILREVLMNLKGDF